MMEHTLHAPFPGRDANAPLPLLGTSAGLMSLDGVLDWILADNRDLELNDIVQPDVLDGGDDLWADHAARIKAKLAGYTGSAGMHGPFFGLILDSLDPKPAKISQERFLQALEYGSGWGAKHMVIHSPFHFFGNPFVGHGAGSGLDRAIGFIHRTLDPVVANAESIGCTIVVENGFDMNPFPLIALAKSFESPRLRLSLDTGHAEVFAVQGGMPPDQWIKEVGPYLAHLHLQDVDGEYDRHWAPGDGRTNWYGVFEALSTLDHTPLMILEPMFKPNTFRGWEYLVSRGLAR